MAKVTGIGGVFFKAGDPAALRDWYAENLSLPVDDEGHEAISGEARSPAPPCGEHSLPIRLPSTGPMTGRK